LVTFPETRRITTALIAGLNGSADLIQILSKFAVPGFLRRFEAECANKTSNIS
jgi:hypothetical protein